MKRTVIVTGAAGGIGRDLIELLMVNDADLEIVGVWHRREPVKPVSLDDSVAFYRCNLTDPHEVGILADAVEQASTPWALINLAGLSHSAIHWKMDAADAENLMDANVASVFNTCRVFSPLMRRAGRGRIINVSSVVAHTGAVGASHYAATKGAVEAFTRSIALELARDNVTANCIALGYLGVGMIESVPADKRQLIEQRIPLGRFGTTPELAMLISYLLSPFSEYMTGQTLHLNGGLHLG